MAVVGNTLSSIGDILYIYSQGAVAGNVTLTGYTDTLVGVSVTRFFNKTFRYSTDAVNYSPWMPLTNPNLSSINGTIPGLLFFEFRYERAGTDTTGLLEFQGISLAGNIIIQIHSNVTTLESIFQDLANNDLLTASICNNLLKKIYKTGILPKFIERGEGIDDTDFVSFWSAICCFLAYVSSFGNQFDQILYKRKYLVEYLKQQNIALSEDQIPFEDLQYIANNFYDQIRRRGTQLIYRKKSVDLDVLKLLFTGANLSTVILDETGKTVLNFGAVISTDEYVSAPSSGLFDGIGTCAVVSYVPKFDLSHDNFIIEAKFNAASFSSPMTILSKDTYGVSYDWGIYLSNNNTITVFSNMTATSLVATVPPMNINEWYDVKLIRQNGINKLYLNDILYAQNDMTFSNLSQVYITIGCASWNNLSTFFNGYIDDLRISRIDPLTMEVDGEWLRLLCRNPYDEFLVDVVEKTKHGFCIGKSSPLYNGTYFSKQINKTEENTENFVDLSEYDLMNYPNVNIVTDGTRQVAQIKGGSGLTGFGYDLTNQPLALLPSQLITVSKEIDYEITFQVKRVSGTGTLNFGAIGYNRNEQIKPLSFQRIDTGAIENTFLSDNLQKTTKIINEWYFVRGIIYAAGPWTVTGNKSKLNNGLGINMKFNLNEDIEKLKICLYLDSNSTNDIYNIYDFKMRPLIKGKNILRTPTVDHGVTNPQFIQNNDIILNWRRNNNQNLDDYQIQNFIEDYLIPYQKRLVQYPLTPMINDKQLLLIVD